MLVAWTLFFLLGAREGDEQGPPALGSQLIIDNDSSCPVTEEVRRALADLRPPSTWPTDQVRLTSTPEGLTIELDQANGTRRDLAFGSDCASRAAAVALVIATWMNDLPAQDAGSPILREQSLAPSAPAPSSPAPAHYEVGAAPLLSAGGGWANGALVELVRLRAQGNLGLRAGLTWVAPREVWVGLGTTRWMRTAASAGVQARKSYASVFFAAELELVGAYTTAWGSSYASDRNAHGFTYGLASAARLGIPWKPLRPWLALGARWWIRGETLQIDFSQPVGHDRARLPPMDGFLAIGLSYAL